ncbi:hypothetical protein [Mycobacterium sp. OTB74]|jgi:hypothetical protein|uniref:hypothetical protein n=1 Tax=Mycobacterium sp. OTB74 TaxID=1853452 RepID=UPI0024762F85|nr:hypothetical protein [Mycobacterium sp. OTB74]MDH6247239.1 hypothetical protein [Mycobacterium sp. OTB74]
MTTTTPAVALPPGADSVGDWEYDELPEISTAKIRVVRSPRRHIIGSPATVSVDAWQREDGTLLCADMNIDLAEHPVNAAQCRELAAHLLELAPLLDTWSAEVSEE